jgi:predicted DNA-binding transcriptional regulator AlpA
MDNAFPSSLRAEPAKVEPVLIDAVSAAKLLSISAKTLWVRTKSGEIPSRRIGGRVLYSLNAIRRWADSPDVASSSNEPSHDC